MHKRGPVHAVRVAGARIVLRKHGGPQVLRPEPFDPEPPGPGEVQVEVAFAGINFAELLQRMGLYQAAPERPFVPGFEVSGTIAHLGEGVRGLEVGQRVTVVTAFGGYASHVNTAAGSVIPVPDGLPLDQAAAFPVTYLTAWEALVGMGRVRAGERVLVHGGAGGVGTAAVTIAQHLGCEVYATCGSPEKVAFLEQELGVTRAFDSRAAPWCPRVLDAVGRMDCVLESQGGRNVKESLKALRPRGRVVVYGAQEVAPSARRNLWKAFQAVRAMRIPILPMVRRSTGVLAFHLLWMWRDGVDLRVEADAILALIEDGKVRPPRVDRVFPFDDVADAHQYIHDRRNVGKVLLKP